MNLIATLCQNNHSSCGSCCGLFNLKPIGGRPNLAYFYQPLLTRRRQQIEKAIREYHQSHRRQSLLQCKYSLEQQEASLPRWRNDIYVCPFLCFIDSGGSRIGCGMHPLTVARFYEDQALDTEEDLRDISFYGQSICQDYDCPAKEGLSAQDVGLLDSLGLDSFAYSALIANHRLLQHQLDLLRQLGLGLQASPQLKAFLSLPLTWDYCQQPGFSQCSFGPSWPDGSFLRQHGHLPRLKDVIGKELTNAASNNTVKASGIQNDAIANCAHSSNNQDRSCGGDEAKLSVSNAIDILEALNSSFIDYYELQDGLNKILAILE